MARAVLAPYQNQFLNDSAFIYLFPSQVSESSSVQMAPDSSPEPLSTHKC